MRLHKEALYQSVMAHEVAESAKPLLPEARRHGERVWDLAGQLLFPASRAGRSRLVLVGLSAAAVLCYSGYLCVFGMGTAEAHLINFAYRGMRENVKVTPFSQTMPRILVGHDGKAYRVTYTRKAGEPFIVLHLEGKPEPVDPANFDKAVEEASRAATDG